MSCLRVTKSAVLQESRVVKTVKMVTWIGNIVGVNFFVGKEESWMSRNELTAQNVCL